MYAAIETRHGGCKYAGDDESGQANRHLSPNEYREDLIGPLQSSESRWIGLIEHKKCRSDRQEQNPGNDGQDPIDPYGSAGLLLIGCRQVALND